jgi:hypothetical protein
MTTENTPHVVYPAGRSHGLVTMFQTYRAAHDFWRLKHDYKTPYLIATLGRTIDPSTPVVDVNE